METVIKGLRFPLETTDKVLPDCCNYQILITDEGKLNKIISPKGGEVINIAKDSISVDYLDELMDKCGVVKLTLTILVSKNSFKIQNK